MEEYLFGIVPETDLERRIVTSTEFNEGMNYGNPRPGHPEGKVGAHVKGIVDSIEKENWPTYREKLRVVALLHDIGKVKTEYSPNGHLVSEPHAVFSEKIARNFTDDESLLETIGKHSKYYSFFRKLTEKNRFDSKQFKQTFQGVNLELLSRFIYCDLFERDQTPAKWFEEKLVSEGLVTSGMTGKLDGLRVQVGNEAWDLNRVQGVLSLYGTDFLLDSLTDHRFNETFGQFVKYVKDGRIKPFVQGLISAVREDALNSEEKQWYSRVKDFGKQLTNYGSTEFLSKAETLRGVERNTYRNQLMVEVAKGVDSITGDNSGTNYLQEQGDQVRTNINGCMVPVKLIKDYDITGDVSSHSDL